MNPPPAIQSPSTPPRRRSKSSKSPHAPPPVERIADSFANASAVSSRSAASEVREISASAFASPVSTSPRAPGEDFGRSDAETASASASSSGSSASASSRRGSPRDANMLSSCFAAAPRAGSHPMPPRNPPAAPVASSCVWRSAGWEDEAPACARWMTDEAAAGAGRCATGGARARRSAAVARRAACASAAPPGRKASLTSPPMSLTISLTGSSHNSFALALTFVVTSPSCLQNSPGCTEGLPDGGPPPCQPGGGRR